MISELDSWAEFSSHSTRTAGVFGTNCCEKSPPSCPRRPAPPTARRVADALVAAADADIRLAARSHATTSMPSASPKPHRLTGRRRPMLGAGVRSAKPVPT